MSWVHVRTGAVVALVALAALMAMVARAPVRSHAATTVFVAATNTGNSNYFSPSVVYITVGDTVQWDFTGGNLHNVMSDGPDPFYSGYHMPGGAPFLHTFNTAGAFNYYCSLHTGMEGTVNVADATATPTPTDTPLPPTVTPTATVSLPTATPEAGGSWVVTSAMVAPRPDAPLARLDSGSVLAVGGSDAGSMLASVERYLPGTNTWSAGDETGVVRGSHTATTLLTGEVLIAGGESAPGVLTNSAQRFDPGVGNWSSTGAMGVTRRHHTATLLTDGRVLAVGGETKVLGTYPPVAVAEVYDRGSDGWSTAGTLGTARSMHSAVRLLDGRVLVAGGFDGSTALDSAEIYTPGSNDWTAAQSMHELRANHTATLLEDGRVLVAGGDDGAGGIPVTSSEIFDPGSGEWSVVASMHDARRDHTATLLEDGRVLVAGGDGGSGALASAELFDPALGLWQTTAAMHAPRVAHDAVRLLDGRVLAAGGEADAQLADAEVYTAGAQDDGDGIAADVDNCPTVFNPLQSNTDAAPVISAGAPADVTRPNGDALGDACDPDDDNDGLGDDSEGALGPGHAHHADCPTASADTDPLEIDTDGDRVSDHAECLLGSDPAVAGQVVAVGPDSDGDGLPDALESLLGSNPSNSDSDGDRVTDGVEVRGYATSPVSTDTDGDGCADGREIASVDGSSAVNSLDLVLVAQRFNRADEPVHDVNKSGLVNSLDLQLVARNFAPGNC